MVALLAAAPRQLSGESGTVHTLSGFGLNVTFDTRWLSGSGYRPVKIDVAPTVPVTADRTLTVEMVASRYWRGSREDDRVVRQIEIPAGSGPVQAWLSVPQTEVWDSYQINVLEDGKLLVPLSPGGSGDAAPGVAWSESLPAVLVVADVPLDSREIVKPFGLAEAYQYYPGGQIVVNSGRLGLPTSFARRAGKLPEKWIDYSGLDLVCLSLEELDGLARQRPKAFRAIVEWTASGGNLCVFGAGGNWRRLGELESLLGLEPGLSSPHSDPARRGWSLPDTSRFGKPLQGMGFRDGDSSPDLYQPRYFGAIVEEEVLVAPEPPPKPPYQPHFITRPFQQGMLVATVAADPFPGTQWEWGWLFATLGSTRVLWYQRHGLSTVRENREFWKLLIPGVGLVPVNGFRVLITLFCVAIGPLNYYLLRRLKRLHLLVLTTPASALVVTLLLFGYALMADGLGTRVRVRSATQIDQRRGHAVCWSRLSYYAGLAPARGLAFPDNVAVLPLEHQPMEAGSRERELVWESGQGGGAMVGRLASGWLTSRTPTQFVTVRSRPSRLGLAVAEPGGPDGPLRIENRLATHIGELLVRTHDGRYWWAADVAEAATADARPVDLMVALDRLEETERKTAPSYPPGMDPQGQRSFVGLGMVRNPWLWRYNQSGAPPPTQATGRLEQAISAIHPNRGKGIGTFRAEHPQGRSGERYLSPFPPPLEPGSYLAIVERSPEVVLGTPAAGEEAGFHLVYGTW